jgi:geranylgeranyl diphosphate synthase type I
VLRGPVDLGVNMTSGVTSIPTTEPIRVAGPPQWLTAATATTDPALRHAIGRLHPDLAAMAEYHKGWADADGHPVIGHSHGKRIRAGLALWSTQVVGTDPAIGLPAATAVELVHDFSLLHDDIMDNDRLRRGRPTVWAVYGIGPAVLLGDALHTLAQTILSETEPHGHRAAARLATTVHDLCRGQAADLQFEHREHVPVQEYLSMVDGKTGALMRAATTLGAIVAGAEATIVAELDRLGHHLGVLFQVVDDLLGIFGDPETTGKPAHSDLVSRKKTLPILAALESTTPAGHELAELLRHPELSDTDLAHATTLVDQAGGATRARSECAWHHTQALAALARLKPPHHIKEMMLELLTFVAGRSP